ncbi:MAG TPA: hypothetical protein VMU25_00755 [Candidatus Paceibacterota bacterium]|nr:hypothetical protein [Candidatus Paceibacterota bacterium]
MYASRRIFVSIGAAFVVAVAALGLWYYEHQNSAAVAAGVIAGPSAKYTSTQFRYAFSYPSKYQAHELEPEFVTIGQMQNGSVEGVANVAVLHAQKSEPLPSSEAFIRLVAGLACSQNSAGSAVNCTTVAQSTPFSTQSGLSGEALYFNSNAGKRGPFYAFDISSTIPNEYAVLLVYPPAQLAQNDADRTLLQNIAQSVQLQ